MLIRPVYLLMVQPRLAAAGEERRSPPWTANGTMIAYRDYSMISLGEGGTLGVFAVLDGGVVSRQMAVVPGSS
jgi:hypothetical protein